MTERVRGVVLRGTGGVWQVRGADGRLISASLRGKVKQDSKLKLAVGDDVDVESEDGESWSIITIHPRRGTLVRRAPGNAYGERVVAANIDQVLIVFAAAQPEPHVRMVDRFLVIAEANEIPAVIVINKIELADEAATRARFSAYDRAGYTVHYTSVKAIVGLEALRDTLHDRVSALTGPSGVGKSSLLNSMYPGLDLRVGEISQSVQKGRHTTVGADLHPLPGGGFVMDTPGLREMGVWGLTSGDLERCFREFRPHIGDCRFSDCRHLVEPGCAIRAAVDRGEIAVERFESYVKLYEELAEAEKRFTY